MSNENNEADTPPDPFELGPEHQAKANSGALAALRHQLNASTLDTDRIRAEVIRHNQSRKAGVGTVDLDADAEIARRGADYAAADWSHLDRLAITRAAIWITHADGLGSGVTYPEYKALRKPRAAGEIPATARAIIRRLSETVTPPDADGLALAQSDALAGIVTRAEQPTGA